MHHTAYVNAESFYKKYCENGIENKRILDVGSYDVNGTLKPIFSKGQYVGLDMEAGPNVDVVGTSHNIPFENESFDIVVSSSCFEHDDFFWQSFLEMCRVLKPGGYMYIQAPSNGPYHGYPGDNWRFYIDSWKALQKFAKNNKYDLLLVDHYIDATTEDPFQARIWNDSIAIYHKVDQQKMEVSINSIELGHHKVTYRGIPHVKCPFDYVTYQMIVNEVKPDLIIEIGTLYGGNSVYLADLLDIIGNGMVHTIDIERLGDSDTLNNHPRIRRFFNGYQGYDLANVNGFNRIMVIDDGSHTYADVKASIEKFEAVVSKGSYLIVEDGALVELGLDNSIYAGGPLRAINEFIETTDQYIIDRKWIDFFGKNTTFNKNGFLRRVK